MPVSFRCKRAVCAVYCVHLSCSTVEPAYPVLREPGSGTPAGRHGVSNLPCLAQYAPVQPDCDQISKDVKLLASLEEIKHVDHCNFDQSMFGIEVSCCSYLEQQISQ